MPTVCYTWNDAPYSWATAPFTWAEGCVIIAVGGTSTYRKKELKELNEEERATLLNLFFRMNLDELVIENRISKTKNKKVKIKLKDVEVLVSKEKLIEIKTNYEPMEPKEEKITVKVKIL